jgi:5-methyltetrahydrofolate--homocysteine methyltransferase
MVAGRAVHPITPEAFAAHVPALVDAGAGIIGGCCGAGPAHIAAIGAALTRTRQ